MNGAEVRFLPVGGANEIGMNMYLYGFGDDGAKGRRWIVVDCGIAFGDADSTPGVETIVPDPIFLRDSRERVEAVFLTHAHEDHVGALTDVWQRLGKPPVYATAFGAEITRRKFREAGLEERTAVHSVEPGVPVEAGPFEVSFQSVVHSIPDSNLLTIRTPVGLLVHSGDFRTAVVERTEGERRLRALGSEGVACLACESTNVLEEGDDAREEDLLPRMEEVFAVAPVRSPRPPSARTSNGCVPWR